MKCRLQYAIKVSALSEIMYLEMANIEIAIFSPTLIGTYLAEDMLNINFAKLSIIDYPKEVLFIVVGCLLLS